MTRVSGASQRGQCIAMLTAQRQSSPPSSCHAKDALLPVPLGGEKEPKFSAVPEKVGAGGTMQPVKGKGRFVQQPPMAQIF
jgi:hypothetical protein